MSRSALPRPTPADPASTGPSTPSDVAAEPARPRLTRRAVVAGAGALGAGLAVAACGNGGATTEDTTEDAGAAPESAPAGTALGPTADVPVGSALIYAEQGVVVTQAAAGSYAGFSTECPHQGCAVAAVEGDQIICPCHDSRFGLDGAVLQGPARSGLTERSVIVDGDQITLS